MDQEFSSTNEFLERQTELLRELAESLERAQAAILKSDVARMSAQTVRQQNLCEELWRLTRKVSPQRFLLMPSMMRSAHAQATTLHPLSERQQCLLTELREAGHQVERLNREYGALLRRARRTVDILCRVLANSGITYARPTSRAQVSLQELKG